MIIQIPQIIPTNFSLGNVRFAVFQFILMFCARIYHMTNDYTYLKHIRHSTYVFLISTSRDVSFLKQVNDPKMI